MGDNGFTYKLRNSQDDEEFECGINLIEEKAMDVSSMIGDDHFDHHFIAKTEHGDIEWVVQTLMDDTGFHLE